MTALFPFIAFLVTSAFVFGVADMFRQSATDPLRRRMDGFRPPDAFNSTISRHSLSDSLAGLLPRAHTSEAELTLELRRAGYLSAAAPNVFLGLRNAAVVVIVLSTAAIVALLGPDRTRLVIQTIVAGLALAGLAWAMPRLLLRMQGRQRIERINRALPFALDLLTMGMSGGLSLPHALRHVSRELRRTHPDLGDELAIVQNQGEMTSLEDAFASFAERVGSVEAAALSALIVQNQRLGTNVASSIDDYAESLRAKWRQSADEQAAKAGVKMLVPLTMFLMPAVMMLLWGPAVLEMFEFIKQIQARPRLEEQLPDVFIQQSPTGRPLFEREPQ